jgi:hypothetical protein
MALGCAGSCRTSRVERGSNCNLAMSSKSPSLEMGAPDAARRLGSFLAFRVATNAPVWFVLGSAVFLYLSLFRLPSLPIYRLGDEAIYLENAVKMLDGQVMYKDFFQFTPPGTESVYVVLLKVFGVRMWVPKAVLIALGTGFAWLSVVISRPLMGRVSTFLPGLLFLTLPYSRALDGTHHWFSSLAVMGVLAAVLPKRTPMRLAVAGALCGLALCFTQLRGLTAGLGLSLFLLWEYRNKGERSSSLLQNEACLWVSFLLTVMTLNLYYVWKVGLARFLWCTVVFGSKYYSAWPGNNWRAFGLDLPNLHPLLH